MKKKKPTKRKKPSKPARKTAARKRKSNPRKTTRKARKPARKVVRKTARKPARKAAGRKRNSTKKRKNARPSLLRLILPVQEMKALAEGAAGDLQSLAPTKGKRNGRRLRRVRSAVPVRSGKGSRKNPYVHAAGKRKGRRNGEQEQAENLYATFHGRNSAETLTFADEVRSREWLGGLGKLVELRYLTPTNYEACTAFEGDRAPQLASSGDGRSLYLVGGDQSIDLAAVEMDGPEWRKDLMLIGVLFELTYQTEKEFHSFQLIDYYHELGEETDVCPMLVYDTLNRRLLIVGGQYQVRPEGITN